MSEFADTVVNTFLETTFRLNATYLALYLTANSRSGRGTEVSGGAYSRLPIFWTPPMAGEITNTNEVLFQATGPWGKVVAIGIENAASAGDQYAFDNDFEDFQMQDQDKIKFPPGSITIGVY